MGVATLSWYGGCWQAPLHAACCMVWWPAERPATASSALRPLSPMLVAKSVPSMPPQEMVTHSRPKAVPRLVEAL